MSPGLKKSSLATIIELPYTEESTLKDALEQFNDGLDSSMKNLKEAFPLFQELFKGLVSAKKNATIYSNEGEMNQGTKTLISLDTADAALKKLVPMINPGAKVRGTRTAGRQVSEEAKSPIDQLIEAILKEKLIK